MTRTRAVALLLLIGLLAGCSAGKKSDSAPKSSQPSPHNGQSAGRPPALPPPAPGDMYFRDAGDNPTVSAARQPVSTFAVDVDTASYTVAREYLERGQLPPPEAVRVEEFINYFPQNYPASEQAVTVHLEGAPSPFRPGTHLIQVGLKAREVERSERQPAVLTFVVDVSGSMDREDRLELVKRALGLLLDQLESDDRVGLVIYGSKGEVVLEHTSDKEKIRRAIDRLKPSGSTNAEEGLILAYELAARNFQEGANNRVILCSDGVANVGATGPKAILRKIDDYRTRNIYLTTVGFGMGNYNDVLMEQLADQGDGNYAYVDDISEAKRIFGRELMANLEVVAKDTKVQVRFDPEQVRTWRLVGYENRVMENQEFRDDTADGGEMGAGHAVTALYEVTLIEETGSDLGTVYVRYKHPETGEVSELNVPIRRRNMAESWRDASARLRWTAAVAEYGGILGQNPWASESSMRQVRDVAWRAARDLDEPGTHTEFLQLMDRAENLRPGR